MTRTRLLPQSGREQVEQPFVRRMIGGDADFELFLDRGQARVRVVDQDGAKLDLSPSGTTPNLLRPLNSVLTWRAGSRNRTRRQGHAGPARC